MTTWRIYGAHYGGPPPGDWYDAVEDGGLDNTGSESVTSGIGTCITAYKAAEKTGLYFPPGTYLLSTTLTVPDDTAFAGPFGLGPTTPTAHLKGAFVFDSGQTFSDLKIGESGSTVTHAEGATTTSFTRCHFRGGGGEHSYGAAVAFARPRPVTGA